LGSVHPQIGLVQGEPLNPFAGYASEILECLGISYTWVSREGDFGFDGDLLLIPNVRLSQEALEFINWWARGGRPMVAFRPAGELLGLFGLGLSERRTFTWPGRYIRWNDGQVLQYHGPCDLLELEGAEAEAWLQWELHGPPSRYPAVVRFEGEGRRAAFAFDLARSAVLFRQGRSDQAGDGTNPDPDGDGMFKPNDLFVNHLDPALKDLPQLDIQIEKLSEILSWAMHPTPLMRIWHLPGGNASAALMSGDSDGCSSDLIRSAFELCESYGAPYTLFLMEDQFGALGPADVKDLRNRGHSVGLHPWLEGRPDPGSFRRYLSQAFLSFKERYGYTPSAVRNHSLIIAGWTDAQEELSDIGVVLDMNWCPVRFFQCGFLTGSARPMRFCGKDGSVLPMFQQPTLTSDDVVLHDKSLLPPMSVSQAIAYTERLLETLRRTGGLYLPGFHPIYIRGTDVCTRDWLKETMAMIRDMGTPFLSADEWARFNLERRSVRSGRTDLEPGSAPPGADYAYRLSTDIGACSITLVFPRDCRSIWIDGRGHRLSEAVWCGTAVAWHSLSLDPGSELTIHIGRET